MDVFRLVNLSFYPVLALLVFFRLETVSIWLLGLVVIVALAKRVAQRRRPDGSDNLSFPSGHSAAAWIMVPVYGWNPLVGWWALLVSTSRVVLHRHYVVDVVAGAVLGVLFGRAAAASNRV